MKRDLKKSNGSNSKEDEEELNVAFEEEIKKPYYNVFYLDDFKLPYDKLNVSVIIPTYNRCPYKPDSLKGDLNPLSWAIKSILLQKPKVSEIVVVDDNSDDYTEKVVKCFEKEAEEKEIKFIYIKNFKQEGYGDSINIGSNHSNSKYLFFVDDDSVIAPYATFGGIYTFEWLDSQGFNPGIINLPPYLRASIPENFKPKKEISQIDFFKGIYLSNKASFPREYIDHSEEKFIHSEFHILKPFPIQNSGGYILCSKKVFSEIGGFPVTIYKRFPEREFGCNVIDNGYSIYFQSDPKFHCVHGSYGLNNSRKFKGDDWFRKISGQISLKKAMQICDKKIESTGCRISPKEFIYHSMSAIFSILYPRNSKGALKWVRKVYDEFVINGDAQMFNTTLIEPLNQEERKEIWDNALIESLEFIKKREMIKLGRINKVRSKVKNKEFSQDVLKLLEGPL